jgi:cell division protein FtsI/penicillin-binding protein 2
LKRREDGSYVEGTNYALASQTEPGSTFKIASAIVALETGKVDTSTMIPTGNGTHNFYGKIMRDWNYNKGGYGKISLNRGIQVSSNIASALIIDELFKESPQKFIEGLYKLGINNDLNLDEKDRNIRRIVERYINEYADELKKHINMKENEKRNDDIRDGDSRFTMNEVIEKFKNNLSNELGIADEEIVANYVIKYSYKSFSRSKAFAWAAYADYIIKNLKNNSNPRRNISIEEVPYKTNDSYEYLGKFYEFKAVNEYR